ATLALGWAELRQGRRKDARLTWMRLGRQFPTDQTAPIALILAAELSAEMGEAVMARKLLDRVLEGHPAGQHAEIARLSRSIMAMRDGRTQTAMADIQMVARSAGPAIPQERRTLLDGLRAAEPLAGPDRKMVLTDRYGGGPAGPVTTERPRRRRPGRWCGSRRRSSTAPEISRPPRVCSTPCS